MYIFLKIIFLGLFSLYLDIRQRRTGGRTKNHTRGERGIGQGLGSPEAQNDHNVKAEHLPTQLCLSCIYIF